MDLKESKPQIADKIAKPFFLIWVLLLPQIALLIFNLSSWALVKGEMSAIQKRMSFEIFAFEVALLLLGISCIVAFQMYKRAIPLFACLVLFIAHVAYLWLFTSWLDKLLPSSVTIWIFTPDEALYYQYIFVMPAIFYTGLRLACLNLPISKAKDISITAVTLVIVPLLGYLFTTVVFRIWEYWNIPTLILTTLFIGATVITMFAFLRILAFVYIWVRNNKAAYMVLLVAVGLVGPIAGLAVNAGMPFPYDFQSLPVYILAAINGLVLLISFKEGTKREALAWFLRCSLYPFSLYFFLVFLPFMPLSLIAIIVMGSGFLILTPVALFIVHSRKIIDEGRRVAALVGFKTAILLFLIAFSIIPSVITSKALIDKHALMHAVDAVYSPDYTKSKLEVNAKTVKHSLLKLRDMKDGVFLPFISSFYNKTVFNGMVLPDYKMNDMYMMFFGEQMPKNESTDRFAFSRRVNFRNTPVNMPERNVTVTDIQVEETQEGQFVKANVQLTLTNHGSEQSEFVTDIQLSPGVFVSGYWLKINQAKVAGQIFEKKTAMWVYHMIRDMTRRDPGLLVYKSDSTLKLSIYPVAYDEKRVTGIELIYPAGMKPYIKVGDKVLNVEGANAQKATKILLAKTGADNSSLIIPDNVLANLPSVERKAYLHFIVDTSANAKNSFSSFGKKMAELASTYASATECKITLMNYESHDLTKEFANISDIETIMNDASKQAILFKGAFCYSRAIGQKLLEFHSKQVKGYTDAFNVPIYVIVMASGSKTVNAGDIAAFARFVPDSNKYYIIQDGNDMLSRTFTNEQNIVSKLETPEPVVLFEGKASVEACTKKSEWGFIDLNSGSKINVYEPNRKTFTEFEMVQVLDSNSPYALGLAAMERYRNTIYFPNTTTSELPEIVKMSKNSGIMNPMTSYMVVENSAQSKMLERKEKQKLGSNQALDFDEFMESPAPPILFLIPAAFALLAFKRRKRSK